MFRILGIMVWKQHVRDYEQRQRDDIRRAQQQVTEAEQALQSEERMFAYLGEHWDVYKGKTPDAIRAGIYDLLAKYASEVAEFKQNDTPEKILANRRKEYEQKVAEKERAIETITANLQHARDGRKSTIDWQKLIYLELVKKLKEVITVLITNEGRIEVQSTQWQELPTVQQTHMDKRAEIANALTHLPVGRAWVRLTTSDGERKVIAEHVIDTRMPTGFSEKELERKRTQVVAYTRANYCKPRHEVEEEIRQRQNIDNQPPTTRIHTL